MRPPRHSMREDGLIYVARQIHWQFFLTIVLPHRRGIERSALRIWKGLYGRIDHAFKMPRGKPLIWLASLEWGASGQNPHLHAIIAGLTCPLHPEESIQTVRSIALKMNLRDVVVQKYDDRLDGVGYLFKEQDKPGFGRPEPDGQWPMPSKNIYKVVGALPHVRDGSSTRLR